ncbi:MAG: carbohydrate porin [Bacteroidota bacterium]
MNNIFSKNNFISFIVTSFIILVLSEVLLAQNTDKFVFGGYLRSGFGLDDKGKAMSHFMAPNAESKYRLGNEAETYLETIFSYLTENESGATFDTRILLAMVTPMNQTNQAVTTTSLREAYVVAKGVWGAHPEAGFWAGQRYYDRHDIHITDFIYRDMSGFGGGIEDFEIGDFKLALAYLGGSFDQLSPSGTPYADEDFVINKSSLDLRLYDINTPLGILGLTSTFSFLNGDSIVTEEGIFTVTDSKGWSVGIFHVLPIDKEDSRNKLNIFYGTGAAQNYRSVMNAPLGVSVEPGGTYNPDDIIRLRVINDLMINFSHKFALQHAILYQNLDNGLSNNGQFTWFSMGLRPIWHFNKYMSLAMEFGWDYTKQNGGDSGSLFKITLAPQITPSTTAMSRPALRLFVTYAFWSDTFKGKVSPFSYGNQTNGLTIGIQAETWW